MQTHGRKLIALVKCLLIGTSFCFAGNPTIWWEGSADNSVHVFNGIAYLYPSHDYAENESSDWIMYDWKCYYSTDLVNWTDGGVVATPGGAAKHCWAPDCNFWNGYYWFMGEDGVEPLDLYKSASPIGPFTSVTENLGGLYDPCFFVDDDNRAYVTFSGSPYSMGELNSTMSSWKVNPTHVNIVNMQGGGEGSFLFKRNGNYYLLWGTTSNGVLNYSLSTSGIRGSYNDKGLLLRGYKYCPGTGHGSVFSMNGQWYAASHMCITSSQYRKAGIWYLHFKDNGDIDPVTQPDTWGVGRYKAFDQIEAENFFDKSGPVQKECSEGGYQMSGITNGSWLKFPKTNFLTCTNGLAFNARVASENGGSIEIRKDSPAGTLLGTCAVGNSGGTFWQTVSCNLTQSPGTYESDIILVFKGSGSELFRLNWFKFMTSDTKPRNAFDELQAESFDFSSGVTTSPDGVQWGLSSGSVINLRDGNYVGFKNVYFGTGGGGIDIRYFQNTNPGSTVEVRTGSPTGTRVGTATLTAVNKAWQQAVAYLDSKVTGMQDIYLVFKGAAGINLCNIDMFRFIESTNCHAPPPVEVTSHPLGAKSIDLPQRILFYPDASGIVFRIASCNKYAVEIYDLSGAMLQRLEGRSQGDTRLHLGSSINRCCIVRGILDGKIASQVLTATQ